MELDRKLSLWALSWPIIIEMFLQFAIGTADTLMVSRISDDAVAVVGFSNQFFNAVLVIFMLVASGSGIVIAQKLGGGRHWEARIVAVMAITITAGIGLAVSLVLHGGAGTFAAVLQVPAKLNALAANYIGIVGSGMIFTALGIAFSICVRNTGNTRSPMYIAFGMNIIHVLLNACFIFGLMGFPKWGLTGVALSTVIVRFAGMLLLLRLFRHAFGAPIQWREFIRFNFGLLKQVVRIGWPMSINGASWMFSQVAIFSVIGVMGTEHLAARTYMNTMESFSFQIGWSLALAVQIQIGHLYGLGRLRDAYFSCYRALRTGLLLVMLNTGLMLVFRQQILSFLTSDPWIVHMASDLLWLNLLLQPGKMLNMAVGQSINAVGDTRFMMLISLPSMWIVALGTGYILGVQQHWGLYGIYAGMIMDEYLRGTILWLRWRRHRNSGIFSVAFSKPNRTPVAAGSP